MLFNHKYKGHSAVSSKAKNMGLSFAPDILREPTFFVGDLHSKLNFREAISALHDVVVADFKFKPSWSILGALLSHTLTKPHA